MAENRSIGEGEVEKVIGRKDGEDGKSLYLVKWKGLAKMTWVSKENLNCHNLVEDYEERMKSHQGTWPKLLFPDQNTKARREGFKRYTVVPN